MAISLLRWLRSMTGEDRAKEISVRELYEAAEEYRLRELAFWSCVNMVANALGRAEFRTYQNGVEVRDREYYMLNVEPNANQNSTAFLHKLVAKLYQENEALLIPVTRRDGSGGLVIADSWGVPDPQWKNPDSYEDVTVGTMNFHKRFREEDVIHLKLNHVNIEPVISGIYQSYVKLLKAAMSAYSWDHGQHWKVHVDQMASGDENWAQTFQEMIKNQIQPFLNSNSAILPELDGWNYQRMDGGSGSGGSVADVKQLTDLVFSFTANAFLIPPVLLMGQVEGVDSAMQRFLSGAVDPIADQLTEELTRKRYGFEGWKAGSRIQVDTSTISHVDLFANAPNIEKLIGSGFSMNDVLRAMGQDPIAEEWADKHYLTKNFAEAQELLREGGNPSE